LSDRAVRFAEGNAGFSEDATVELFMKDLMKHCRSFLCRDLDGRVIIDFMGEGIHTIQNGTQQEMLEAVEKAYRFVHSECTRLRQDSDDEHDKKLAVRYSRLEKYMQARLPLWGLAHLLEAGDGK